MIDRVRSQFFNIFFLVGLGAIHLLRNPKGGVHHNITLGLQITGGGVSPVKKLKYMPKFACELSLHCNIQTSTTVTSYIKVGS